MHGKEKGEQAFSRATCLTLPVLYFPNCHIRSIVPVKPSLTSSHLTPFPLLISMHSTHSTRSCRAPMQSGSTYSIGNHKGKANFRHRHFLRFVQCRTETLSRCVICVVRKGKRTEELAGAVGQTGNLEKGEELEEGRDWAGLQNPWGWKRKFG